MNGKKNVAIAVAATLCLTSALFALRANANLPYNPWWDITDDGKIDINDLARVSGAFGSIGQKINKSQILYDSGWLDISDKKGSYFDVTHNLGLNWNSTNYTMTITGKKTLDGPILRVQNTATTLEMNSTIPSVALYSPYYSLSIIETTEGGRYEVALSTPMLQGALVELYPWLDKKASFDYHASNSALNSVIQTRSISDNVPDNLPLPIFKGPVFVAAGFINNAPGGHGGWDALLCQYNLTTYALATHSTEWNKTYGGAGSDAAYSVVRASTGGFALAGHTDSYGNAMDAYIVITDSQGNMLWSNHFGGASTEEAHSIIQTSDGGYALAGYTQSYPPGTSKGYLVKTDWQGNMLWNKTYAEGSNDFLYSLVQTSDGGYALAGGAIPTGFSNGQMWLVKTDSSGNLQWSKTYGYWNGMAAAATSMIKTNDDGFALAGYTDTPTKSWDMLFVKTDSLGTELSSVRVGGSGRDEAHSLIQISDGGYVMAGYTDPGYLYVVKIKATGYVSCVNYGYSTLTFHRDSSETDWNYLRVQIIKRK